MFEAFYEIIKEFSPEWQLYLTYLPHFSIAFFTGVLLTPIIGYIAVKLNIFDLPAHERKSKSTLNTSDNPTRHIHKKRVPFLGGLAVLIPFIGYMLFTAGQDPVMISILIATGLITVAGALDDIFNLPSKVQFGIHILAAFIIAFSVVNIEVIQNPFGGYFNLNLFSWNFSLFGLPQQLILPGDLIIIGWIVVCINAVKWVGGSDGILEGNSVLALVFLFIIGLQGGHVDVAQMSILLSGTILGFLIYNFPPAKIYTGASGKTAYGFLIAVFAIISGSKIATTMILLFIPLVDFVFVLVNRIIKHKPRSLAQLLKINDKTHLHHKLLELGLTKKQTLLVESSVTLLVGSLGVLTAGVTRLFLLFLIGFIGTIILLILHQISKKRRVKLEQEKEAESPESKYSY
ncbi:hypothetical protein GF357_02065 [Candidatus Dojkabacteria bacterium]|nr:hypothetical protein [Candidatus Dojkabacteria bacterium]